MALEWHGRAVRLRRHLFVDRCGRRDGHGAADRSAVGNAALRWIFGAARSKNSRETWVSRPLVIVFMGPPGSGKGTQSRILSETLSVLHVSTGEALREAVRANSPLGQQVRQQMNSGSFVSDAVVSEIVAERIRAGDCKQGFILDGFPRTLPQAETLGELLKEIEFAEPLVFNLGVDAGHLEARICGRL